MIEYEVTIPRINIEDARRRLEEGGAVLERPAFMQRHIVFNMPVERRVNGSWMRVREEEGRVTMSLKILDGDKMTDQQEYLFIAQNTKDACRFLELMGAQEKARQEKRREIWKLEDCEVTIDEWPFLEPFIEVEGPDEKAVYEAVGKIGYDRSRCRICAVDVLYSEKYGISEDIIDNYTPRIMFDMANPFADSASKT